MKIKPFVYVYCIVCGKLFKRRRKAKKYFIRMNLRPVKSITCSKDCSRILTDIKKGRDNPTVLRTLRREI
jgi:hypothetical protein